MLESEGRQPVEREEAHVLALVADLDAAAGDAARVGEEDHALAGGLCTLAVTATRRRGGVAEPVRNAWGPCMTVMLDAAA